MTAFGHYTTAREVLQRGAACKSTCMQLSETSSDLTGAVALITGGNAGTDQPSGMRHKAWFLPIDPKFVLGSHLSA